MDVKLVTMKSFPGGTELHALVQVRFEHEADGWVYASAPDLGMWIDGVGQTETEALVDLERIIKAQKSLCDLECEPATDYHRAMKSAFDRLVS